MKSIKFLVFLLSFSTSSIASVIKFSELPKVKRVIENGILTGAKNISLNNIWYDVKFKDGSCINLFNGCYENSVFMFQSEYEATIASQALLDYVFLDTKEGLFDSYPNLTNGCNDGSFQFLCRAATPYEISIERPGTFNAIVADNFDIAEETNPFRPAKDGATMVYGLRTLSTFNDSFTTWALWQRSAKVSVPEPSAYLLMGLGLIGLAYTRKKTLSYN